jgi:hypothetical protein
VSDLVGNGGSMRVIPEDLRLEYDRAGHVLEFGQCNEPDRWKLQLRLIERIADLSAENARLKQPVTDEEFKRHWNVLHTPTTFANAVLASRSKEPKGATE